MHEVAMAGIDASVEQNRTEALSTAVSRTETAYSFPGETTIAGPGMGGLISISVLLLLLALIAWQLYRRLVKWVDKRAQAKMEKRSWECQSARLRHIGRMELEAATFKQTEQFRNLERQAAARDRGIQPEHRRTLQSNRANTNASPLSVPFRPNVCERYRIHGRRA
ncbi:transmembrane protein [Cystoisospora suis]|uniref:Transmembrane protein n=1 Tax=Cystoisospora suis TaxID=483139 RepID=A0A2C6KVU9_9APIC|nr:transmembrane protein [Cystoisospora suis]